MNKGVELLKNAIEKGELSYYRQTGSYAYAAEYEDGQLQIVYNAASAKEARPNVDFELIAWAKWSDFRQEWHVGKFDDTNNYVLVQIYDDEENEWFNW